MLDLQKIYKKMSDDAYADIALRVEMASQSLRLIAMAVRHRESIFGDDQKNVGDFVVVTFEAADALTADIQDSIIYGCFYDRSEDVDQKKDRLTQSTLGLMSELQVVSNGLGVIAATNVIPDNFPDVSIKDDAKDVFKESFAAFAHGLENIAQSASKRTEEASATIVSWEKLLNENRKFYEETLIVSGHITKQYAQICEGQLSRSKATLSKVQSLSLDF